MEIQKKIQDILDKLVKADYEAYIVGGCVRDLLMEREPVDWDITTNAKPEEIMKVFPDSKYENEFGTVLVSMPEDERVEGLKHVEITTYRSEQGYSDRRHPDEVIFEEKLEKDLERRDFTINSMAMTPSPPTLPIGQAGPLPAGDGSSPMKGWVIVDLFGGQKDLKKRVVRAVGEPIDRFKEDALRMMRAIRFSVQLGFEIEPKTERAIVKMAGAIKFVSKERIHDELVKILSSNKPADGILLLHKTKLLQYIIPELENAVDVKQNKHHTYSVFKHLVESLRHTKNKEYQVRLASLLHDIGKPKTKEGKGEEATFYNHEYAGAKMAKKIMERLKFSRDDIDRVTNLIRHHMFYYNTDEVTASSVRRLINKVGKENLQDLIDLRVADRLGSGTPKAMPYKLRHLQYMMEKVQNDPVSVKMLKINGDELMPLLKIKPGPKIGAILEVLLSEVIEDPNLNDKKLLEKRSKELNKLDLDELRTQAKEVIKERREVDDSRMKKGFYVK